MGLESRQRAEPRVRVCGKWNLSAAAMNHYQSNLMKKGFILALSSRGRVHNSGEGMAWLQEQESGWSQFYKHTGSRGRVCVCGGGL